MDPRHASHHDRTRTTTGKDTTRRAGFCPPRNARRVAHGGGIMTRRSAGRMAAVIGAGALAIGGWMSPPPQARAGDTPPVAAIAAPPSTPSAGDEADRIRRPAPRSPGASRGGPWWMGATGVVVVFAGLGYAVWAARQGTLRLPRHRTPRGLEVVGRTALTPRHQVHLLRAGDRILLIGTGPGGSPAFLGEWTGPDPAPPPASPQRAGGGA